jgi:hypothetical protein
MKRFLIAILLLATIIESASSAGWSGFAASNSTSWQISRHSQNFTVDISGYVEGTVSPVERNGRVLRPYVSYSKDVDTNGAIVRERTAALQGKYMSEDQISVRSRITNVSYELYKPSGTDIWTADFFSDWPVTINSSRSLDYIGHNINNRAYIGNGKDYIGEDFLYNVKLINERKFNLSANSLNARIFYTNDTILQTDLFENKELDYSLQSHSTGIADLSFKQSDSEYSTQHRDYETATFSEERHSGDYTIARNIKMKSNFSMDRMEDEFWLPCCSSQWTDMNFGNAESRTAKSVFDCTCIEADKKS